MGLFGNLFSGLSDEVKEIEAAAKGGDLEAQYKLALRYSSGNGAPQDEKMVHKWLKKSADAGYAPAQVELGKCYEVKRFQGPGGCQWSAFQYYKKAADQEYGEGCFLVGYYYENDMGGEKQDYGKAKMYYEKAISLGYIGAASELAGLYSEGLGVDLSFEKAAELLLMGANAGDACCQNNLGWLYQNGWGVPQDTDKAIEWYRKAARQGERVAVENLKKLGVSM